MINSTSTIYIDGAAAGSGEFIKVFSVGKDDKFSRWVVRPLALITVLGIGVAMLFASAFLILLSLAMVPFLVAFLWAIKTKLARDVANAHPVADSKTSDGGEQAADVQTAS